MDLTTKANMLAVWPTYWPSKKAPMEIQDSDLSRIIADNLIHCRYRKGGTQSSVAQDLQLSRSTITHIESGLGNPSMALVAKMAKYYNVRVDELLQDPFDQKRVMYRKGNVISRLASEALSVRQVRSHRNRIWLRELECSEEVRIIRLKPQSRESRELLICYQGEVSVGGFCESVLVKAGDTVELVPFVEKKIWVLQVPMRAALLQIKD